MINHVQNKNCGAVLVPTILLVVLISVMIAASGDIAAQTKKVPAPVVASLYPPLIVTVKPIYGTKKTADMTVGFEITVANIPTRSAATPPVPFVNLTCYVEIMHMETGRRLNASPIRIPLRAFGGVISSSVMCKQTSRRPLNSGTWLVEARIKLIGTVITTGTSAFSITPERLPLEMALDRKEYEALLDRIEECRKEVDAYAELYRREKIKGAQLPQEELRKVFAERKRELKSQLNKIGKNKIRAINSFGGLKRRYSSLIDAYAMYAEQTIVDLLGPDYLIKQAIEKYDKEGFLKQLEKAGYLFDNQGPSEDEQIRSFVEKMLKKEMAKRTKAMQMCRAFIAKDIGLEIVTAKTLAGDLAMIKAMTDNLFKAYLAAERDFPVKPAVGIVWEQQWLDDYEQIQSVMPARYRPAKGLPGFFVDYPGIDKKIDLALRAMRSLRDELLVELYERHKTPQTDREPIGVAPASPKKPGLPGAPAPVVAVGNPLQVLYKNYADLEAILKKERKIYIVPLIAVYADLATVRAQFGIKRKLKTSALSDLSSVQAKATKVFKKPLSKFTLPKGTEKHFKAQVQKLRWAIIMNMSGKRIPIPPSNVAPGAEKKSENEGGETEGAESDGTEGEIEGVEGEDAEGEEEPETELEGKSKKFSDAILGAYDRFVGPLLESLEKALLTEPLPEKPILRTFEQIEEDDRKEDEEKEEE